MVNLRRWRERWLDMPHDTLIPYTDFSVVKRWMVAIQTPVRALEESISVIESGIDLVQGNYSHCMYVRRGGQVRFKNEDDAYGDTERPVRAVDSAEIALTLPHDPDWLSAELSSIRDKHVHEEPTIGVNETWGCLTGDDIDADNANRYRYCNHEDANAIYGDVAGK